MKVYIGKTTNGSAIIDTNPQTLHGAQIITSMPLEEYQKLGHHLVKVVIENGKAVLKLDESVKKQMKIKGLKTQLEKIDRDSGASSDVRDVSISAGVVLDAIRVLISRFAKELNIALPAGFGKGVTSAADILALAPASNATEPEKEDFAVYKALLLVSHFDPAINPGLKRIKEAEMKAIPVMQELEELTNA